jgi:hypothetical protein
MAVAVTPGPFTAVVDPDVVVGDAAVVDVVVVAVVLDDEHPATVMAATNARAPATTHFPRCSPMVTLSPIRNLYQEPLYRLVVSDVSEVPDDARRTSGQFLRHGC